MIIAMMVAVRRYHFVVRDFDTDFDTDENLQTMYQWLDIVVDNERSCNGTELTLQQVSKRLYVYRVAYWTRSSDQSIILRVIQITNRNHDLML